MQVLPIFKKLTTAAIAGVVTLTVAAPAEARDRYYRHHRGGGDDAAIAIGAGVIGLALGAAIASGNRNDRDYYDDRYYYPRQNYYESYPQQYYAYPQQYYRQDYYQSYPRGYNNNRRWKKHHNRHDRWRRHDRHDRHDRYYRD